MRIMLVDDSRTICKIQKKTLVQLGYTDVAEAADGVEARSLYKESPPDLMLIDWNMPNMPNTDGSGWESNPPGDGRTAASTALKAAGPTRRPDTPSKVISSQ